MEKETRVPKMNVIPPPPAKPINNGSTGFVVLRLEKNEVELLFTALDKLPVQGLQAANFVLSVAAKLQTSLQEPPKPPPPLPQEVIHKQG